MQDYRRKIAYLYAYEGGEKLGNAGFVKAEDRGGICRLAVHLRCYSRSGEDPGKVYLYFRHRQQLVGIYLGALKNRNGALIFCPTAQAYGLNMVHFGVVMVVVLCIGLATPPVGINLYVASSVGGQPVHKIIPHLPIPLLTIAIATIVLILCPPIVTLLPTLFG